MTTQSMRETIRRRREERNEILASEMKRLTEEAAALGVERVVLFGSFVHGNAGITSDLDLLIVWDTSLDFVTRTAELYRRLKPRVAVDLLVYTPAEFANMADRPFVKQALHEGKVLYEA